MPETVSEEENLETERKSLAGYIEKNRDLYVDNTSHLLTYAEVFNRHAEEAQSAENLIEINKIREAVALLIGMSFGNLRTLKNH